MCAASDAARCAGPQSSYKLAARTPSMTVDAQLLAEWLPSLRGAPQRAHGSHAASAIGSDLVPTWTGQAAAHGGHAGLAEVERVFSTFMYHILVARASRIVLTVRQMYRLRMICKARMMVVIHDHHTRYRMMVVVRDHHTAKPYDGRSP